MRSLAMCVALIYALFAPAVAGADHFIPMDQQINIGLGNAILPDDQTPGGLDKITFENEAGVGFTRMHFVVGNGMNSWYGGPWIDLVRAGIGAVDLSQAGSRIEFDARYYQAPEDYTPGTPWTDHDAPIGLYLQSSADDWREFGYPYHSIYGDPPHPTWTHIVLDNLHSDSLPKIVMTDYGVFDPRQVTTIGFFGTDWPGQGNDFIDIKSLQIHVVAIPEPETCAMMLAGLGLLAFAARRRKQATT